MTADSPSRFCVASDRVLLPGGLRPATVGVEGSKIVDIADRDQPGGGERIDVGDLIVAPGVVDSHVHINEPGRADWEGFRTATAAAAAGGVTTLIDMPLNSRPVTTSVEALDTKRAAANGQCWVDAAFYGGLIPGGADHVKPLIDAGAAGIKAFLCDSGLDDFPASGEADLRAAATQLAERGAPLLVHAELPNRSAVTMGDARRYAEYLASRPEAWEADAIELLLRVASETGCRVHVVHLANAGALEMLERARGDGLPVTVETCPHYLHFAAESIPDGDTRFKCAPPIRRREHRESLWGGLQRGVIDTIGSDHSPCPPEMKRFGTGDFLAAWGGIAGLQLTLPVVWTGAVERGVAVERVFDWLSRQPAELFGLGDRKGKIAVGADADLVVFDPDATWRVDGAKLRHRHKLTPYHEQALRGRVVQTFVGGRCVFEGDRLVGEATGRLLTPRFDRREGAA